MAKIRQETASLEKTLVDLAQEDFTGSIRVSADTRSCYLVFRKGELTLAETYLPSAEDFLTLLGRRLKSGIMDSLIEYTSRRIEGDSIRTLLEVIIRTRAVSWPEIEAVMQKRMVILLEQLLPHVCTVDYQVDTIDISYGEDGHGIRCTTLFQAIQERQPRWKQYRHILPTVEMVPHVREGVLPQITNETIRQHLQKWVDGQRSFAAIAEGLDQDPLALLPLYARWVQDGYINFLDLELVTQSLPTILSVDDSPIVQTLLRRALQSSYELFTAASALEAMGVLNHNDINLLILDVTMPDINGLEFCRTLRKVDRFRDLPVIMLTAKDGLIDRAKGHLAGANRYLTKPIDKDALLATIQDLLVSVEP